MALIKCRKCGAEISDKSINCIYCGCNTTDNIKENLEETFQKEKEKMKEDFDSKLAYKESEKIILENQNKDLQNELRSEIQRRQEDDLEKEKLKKELEEIKYENNKLENKLDTRKREDFNKFMLVIKNIIKFFISAFRYFWGVLFSLSSIPFFSDNQIKAGIVSILFGISCCPFIYNILWDKIKVTKAMKIGLQILIPFILFMLWTGSAIIYGGNL